MERVRVTLLGGFAVEIDGLTVTTASFERRSGAHVVQYLALADGRQAHREQVIDALWPDVDRSSGMNRLNKAATFARNALGRPDAVVVRNDVLTLFPDEDVWVDADALTDVDVSDADAAAELVDACGGELLPESPYDEWTVEPRMRLHLRQAEILRAAGEWERLLRHEPTDEEAHLAVMRASLERGDRAAVARRYAHLEETLAEQLGIVPSPAADLLLRQAEQDDGPDVPDAAPSEAIRTVLIARPTDDHEPASVAGSLGATVGPTELRPDGTTVAVYGGVADATIAAVEIQRRLQATGDSCRLALDIGSTHWDRGGWHGDAVRRAESMVTAAADGQILSTGAAAELAPSGAAAVTMVDLGLFQLGDLAPTRLHRVVAPDVESPATPPRANRLRGRPVAPGRTATFGRDAERSVIADDVRTGPVVTIVGAGGAGKTHLARRVAVDVADEYPGGSWWCELGNVSDDDGAAQEILSAVGGLRHPESSAIDSIIATLGDRLTLLVLDNCEHVLDTVRELAARLTAERPATTVLATSREPLAVADERLHRLEPLGPDAASTLFVSEALRHGGSTELDDVAVARICTRLDGLPLALRLAAARTRSIDLVGLEALLADRFEFLSAVEPGGLEHQQTLAATIAWSVNALDTSTRTFLTTLSAFANRFDLDDAVAVTGESLGSCLRTIDELVKRSLLVGPERTTDGRSSYRMLESVRLFVRGELGGDARVRHLEHMVARAQRWNSEIGSRDNRGIVGFENGWDDIRRAVATAIDTDRYSDAATLLAFTGLFANLTMRFEVLDWYPQVFGEMPDDPTRFELVARSSWSVLATYNGDFDTARRRIDEVLAIDPDFPDAAWAAAWLPWTGGDLDETRMWLNKILESDDPNAITNKFAAMHLMSIVDFADGRDISEAAMLLDVLSAELGATARSLALASRGLSTMWTDAGSTIADAEECIGLSDRTGLINTAMTARSVRALASMVDRPVDHAAEVMRDTLTFAADRGLWSWVYAGSGTAAGLFERAGRPDVATMVLGAREAAGYRSGFTARLVILLEAQLREEHADDFDVWWRTGQLLSRSALLELIVRTTEEISTDQTP